LNNFYKIKEALEYIDYHLDEPISLESISKQFHFSPYYFHRMFALIVGKTIAVHVRDRRLLSACSQLASTNNSVLNIALDSGYNSAQSFTRAFKNIHGLSPSEYRKQGLKPYLVSVDEMIMKFTNKLKGGIYMNPKIIKKNAMMIACTSGDVRYIKTPEIWQNFKLLSKKTPLTNKICENSYEVRTNVVTNGEEIEIVYAGSTVSSENVDSEYVLFKLPASEYIVFDVIYPNLREPMYDWLKTHHEYKERLFDGVSYLISNIDERYTGDIEGSIVEYWIPIEKKL